MSARLGLWATALASTALVLSLFPALKTLGVVAALLALAAAVAVRYVTPAAWIQRIWAVLATLVAVTALVVAVGVWTLIGGTVLVILFTRGI